MKFTEKTISDQKRLVRGEHLRFARSILRARDAVHHNKWRVFMMAGGAPGGEIAAIRSLMPKAYIVAGDKDPHCLEAAIECGVDDVVLGDVLVEGRMELKTRRADGTPSTTVIPPEFIGREKYDLFDLDLCGHAGPDLMRMASVYMRQAVIGGGVFMLTFSYGRDVSELFMEVYRQTGRSWEFKRGYNDVEKFALPDSVPDAVAARIMYLFSPSVLCWLRSIMVYRGPQSPMCSLLFQVGRINRGQISSVIVEGVDFELAVARDDVSALYDVPQERIEALRRSLSARKAAATKRAIRLRPVVNPESNTLNLLTCQEGAAP